MLTRGTKVVFRGRVGTVVGLMPGNMIDVRFADAPQRVERRPLSSLARRNPDEQSWRVVWGEDRAEELHRKLGLKGDVGEFFKNLDDMDRDAKAQDRADLSASAYLKSMEIATRPQKLPALTVPSETAAARWMELREAGIEEPKAERKVKTRGVAPIRKVKTEETVEALLARYGVTSITRPDPPRMSSDRKAYCGNPIDGTAYFLFVSHGKRAPRTRVLTESDYAEWVGERWQRLRGNHAAYSNAAKVLLRNAWNVPTGEEILESETGYSYKNRRVSQEEMDVMLREKEFGHGKFVHAMMASRGANVRAVPVGFEKRAVKGAKVSVAAPYGALIVGGEMFQLTEPSVSAGSERLENLRPYRKQTFRAEGQGTIIDEVSRNLGIPKYTAHLFLESGGVRVKDPSKGWRAFGEVVTDGEAHIPAGYLITLGLADKDQSPFFSWRLHSQAVPRWEESARCLTPGQKEASANLQTLASMISQVATAFKATRTLFTTLQDNWEKPLLATRDSLGRELKSPVLTDARLDERFGYMRDAVDRLVQWVQSEGVSMAEMSKLAPRAIQAVASLVNRALATKVATKSLDGWNTKSMFSEAAALAADPRLVLAQWMKKGGGAPPVMDYARAVSEGTGSVSEKEDQAWALLFLRDTAVEISQSRQDKEAKSTVIKKLFHLADVYYMLNGYEFGGPLKPGSAFDGRAKELASSLREARWSIESGDVTSPFIGRRYSVYMTYNPILYDLTRKLWKVSANNPVILKSPDALNEMDRVGVYGSLMSLVHRTLPESADEKELGWRLFQILGYNMKFLNAGDLTTVQQNYDGSFREGNLSWPIGDTASVAAAKLSHFINDPSAYLATLKDEVRSSIAWFVGGMEKGEVESVFMPKAEMAEYTPRGFTRASVFEKSRMAAEEHHKLVSDIDRALAVLGGGR